MSQVCEDLSLKVSDKAIKTKWFDGNDGYYYYKSPLQPFCKTDVLFTSAKFSVDMNNKYQNCNASVLIYAQGVQSDNNGETIFDATGWPEENVQ